MNLLETISNLDLLFESMIIAVHRNDPFELAGLFASGKSELDIRTIIQRHFLNSTSNNFVVTREWQRHDFAILKDGNPILVVEGKSWIHRNPTQKIKWTNREDSIRRGFEQDANKLKLLKSKYPDVNTYISTLLFSVDVTDLSQLEIDKLAIKYGNEHRIALHEMGNFQELISRGREIMLDFLEQQGATKLQTMKVESYHELNVEVDLFLTKIS